MKFFYSKLISRTLLQILSYILFKKILHFLGQFERKEHHTKNVYSQDHIFLFRLNPFINLYETKIIMRRS